jgi:Ca2+-binding EF-hand superfamily protein
MRDQINNLEADEHLIQCFRVLDRVDNGYVSAAEFKHLMTYGTQASLAFTIILYYLFYLNETNNT